MRGDGNNCNHRDSLLPFRFIGSVVPEDSISARCVILRVRLEYLLAVGACQRRESMRIQTWVVRVQFEVAQRFTNLLKDRFRRFLFKFAELPIRRRSELNLSFHA